MFAKICKRAAVQNTLSIPNVSKTAKLAQPLVNNQFALTRGFMTAALGKTQPQASIWGQQPVRMFNTEAPAEGGDERPPPKHPIDERVPRYTKNQLILLGIPDSVTEEMIQEKFQEYGNLSSFKYETQSDTGNERGGRCFMTVESDQVGDKVIADLGNETTVGDATVTLFQMRNRDWPRWRRSIYVSNCNWNAEEWHLDEFFSDCGEILSIRLVRDNDGRSRGFGFVEFLDRSAAARALYKDGNEFLGRQLRVGFQNRPKPREFTD